MESNERRDLTHVRHVAEVLSDRGTVRTGGSSQFRAKPDNRISVV
jgi:hypothetical protein